MLLNYHVQILMTIEKQEQTVRITNDVCDAIIMIGTFFLYTRNRTCYLKEKCTHNCYL